MNTNMLKVAIVAALALTSLSDALTLTTEAMNNCHRCYGYCNSIAHGSSFLRNLCKSENCPDCDGGD